MNPSEKKKLLWVFILNLLTVIADMMGILSIFPFLQLVMNPKIIHENHWLNQIYTYGGFGSDKGFLIFTGLGLMIVFTLSNILKGYSLWISNQFAFDCNRNVSTKLLKIYFNESYLENIKKNSAQVASHLFTNVDMGISNILTSWISLLSSSFIVLILLGVMFTTQPFSALMIFLGAGTFYYLLERSIKIQLGELGQQVVANSRVLYKHVNESTGGVKEIKYLGRADKFIRDYDASYEEYVNLKSKNNLFQIMPKLIIDTLAFAIGIFAIIFLLGIDVDLTHSIPWMGLFAFIILRLVPNSQVILQQVSKLRFSNNALDLVYKDLIHLERLTPPANRDMSPLPFKDQVEFSNVSFAYSEKHNDVLKNISFTIKKGEMIAFVGKTGSGKTTLIDIILGLIPPTKGQICIDETVLISELNHRWQKNIGYVPQFVFLADTTITNNIAFGIKEEFISQADVIEACKKANIHEFIMEKLPMGYNTIVGERGIQLSGGQRQRLGIARALYHDPGVIILDEATSALDHQTENSVMDEINKIAGIKTIIIIAHRLATVEKCNRIILLEDGKIISSGKYSEMVLKEPDFFKKVTG